MSFVQRALSPGEAEIVDVVRQWIDREVMPDVARFEHSNTYPEAWIEQMKQLGVYGLLVPPPHGDLGVSMACFAAVTEELARGWMSLAGAMGGHSVVVTLLRRYGTPEQRDRWLPTLATGHVRATMALTEPAGGSDLQAITTTARRDGDTYRVNGSKTWISNAQRAGLFALLCKTDPAAMPRHRGISVLLVEPGQGITVGPPIPKLGYKGVEACEVVFDDAVVPADAVLGGEPGAGFGQMMNGLEVGRVQVAARATGVARAAFDAAIAYAEDRETFGRPIWQHQAVGHRLADMATKLQAARLMLFHAAECYDAGERSDLEAGMAKLYASEVCLDIATSAIRVHGGYGFSAEYQVERYYRDAPLMIVGEGTNEILRDVIVRQLMARRR